MDLCEAFVFGLLSGILTFLILTAITGIQSGSFLMGMMICILTTCAATDR